MHECACASRRYITIGALRTQNFYDGTGNLIKTIDANDNVTRNWYNKAGQLSAQLDAKRYLTVYQRDAFGNVDKQISYANAVTGTVDDSTTEAQLAVAASTDDRSTSFTYDRMGRTLSESRLNVAHAAVNASTGALAEATAAAITTYVYDGLSNITRRTDANGAIVDTEYDKLGRKTRDLEASFVDHRGATVRATTDYEYNGLDLLRRQIGRGEIEGVEADDRITSFTYGAGGYLTGQTDPAGVRHELRLDAAGNITRKTLVGRINADALKVDDITYYVYDTQGREIHHTDGATGVVVETRYNAFGQISGTRTNPAPGSTAWAEFSDYDQAGRAWRTNGGDGITKVHVYDANGNATLKLDHAVTDLADSAQKTWTFKDVLELNDTNQFYSVYDARNQLRDTFQPQMVGSHNIIKIEKSLTQKQGINFATLGAGLSMGVAAGLTTVGVPATPSAPGTVSITQGQLVTATLTNRYSITTSYYGELKIRLAAHTLALNIPDTSAWGSGDVRVDIDIDGSGGFDGCNQSFFVSSGSPTASFTFSEGFNPEMYFAGGSRQFTYTLFKQGPVSPIKLGSYTWTRPRPTDGTFSIGSTISTGDTTVHFADQKTDAERLVLMTRPSGSTGGWSVTNVPKAVVDGAAQGSHFKWDWSPMARGSYEFRYVVFNGNNDVVNSQQGTMSLLDASPTIAQNSRTMGGAGRAFVDSNGSIVFNELGGLASSLTVSYRKAGGAWTSVELAPSVVGGVTLPGWFTFAPAGLTGTYEYTIDAKSVGGTTINKSSSTFTVGSPTSVSDPSGVSVQTSPTANVTATATAPQSLQASFYRSTKTILDNGGGEPFFTSTPPINKLTLPIPETSAWGSGNIRVEVTIDGSVGEGSYSGFQGSFDVLYGTSSTVLTIPESTVEGGGEEQVRYSYTLYKKVGGHEVQLASYSGYTASAVRAPGQTGATTTMISTTTSPVHTTASLIGFEVTPIGGAAPASRMLLQYRRPNIGGWTVTSIPQQMVNGQAIAGRFALDASVVSAGTYEYRTLAIDATGNIVHSGGGVMTIGPASVVTPEAPRLIGGTGQVFMDAAGNLNFTEQGTATATLSIRTRAADSAGLWSARSVISPATIAGLPTPGWFVYASPPGVSGKQEYVIEARNSAGQLLGKTAGTYVPGTDNGGSVSQLVGYSEPPVVTHFHSQPLAATSMRLSYRPSGSGAYTVVMLPKVAAGVFDWISGNVFNSDSASANYDYMYESLDNNGVLVNQAHGVVTLGLASAIVSHISDSVPTLASFNAPDGNAQPAIATSLVLQYRLAGNGSFASIVLARSSNGSFVWDASALVPPGTSGTIDYSFTLMNGATTLLREDGSVLSVSGTLHLGPTDGEAALKWLETGSVQSVALIHHAQATNAFGEVVSETNARGYTTSSFYNALGKLVLKKDPSVNITLANGFQHAITPSTYYHYDKAGRLLATRDANGNLSTLLLQGSGNSTTAEFFADGGNKVSRYDILGDLRYGVDEMGLRTDYSYDKNGRLTLITRPTRTDGTRAEVHMTYDAAGNRITQAATPDAWSPLSDYTNKTYYDSLGRVTKVVTPAGRSSSYTYVWDAAIKSTGGRVVGGWRQTIGDPMGRTVIDEIDAYGRTTAHTDLGGRTFVYNFNHAGWLSSQSGSTGQNIAYTYYANGYVKSIRDIALGSETQYEYDAVGNRVYEAYRRTVAGKVEFLQNASIDYDSNNRVTRIHDPMADIQYEYDAVGNRRRVKSQYHDGVDGSRKIQDYWYDYDNMNRFTVTMGKLSSDSGARAASAGDSSVKVVLGAVGSEGVQVWYNKGSQRIRTVTARGGHREDYTYGSEGYLEVTYSNANAGAQGAKLSERINDRLGRTTTYTEYNAAGVATYLRTTAYTNDGRQRGQNGTDGAIIYNYYNARLANGADSLAGISTSGVGELAMVETTNNGVSTKHYTAYEYWDEAKQKNQTLNGYVAHQLATVWRPGMSQFEYDINGHLNRAVDAGSDGVVGGTDDVKFEYISNAQGLVLRREQYKGQSVGIMHRYLYLNGATVGDVGNDGDAHLDYAQSLGKASQNREQMYKSWRPVSSADFDQNFQPITRSYPAATGSSYTARAGDTLYAIAGAVWGDVSMWYLIADANGLSAETALKAGQTLTIPNKIANIHNNSSTMRPYDAGAIIGDVSPTLPDMPPPAPPQQPKGCGVLGKIIVVVIAAVVSFHAGPAIAKAILAAMSTGSVTGAVAAGAISAGTAGTIGTVAGAALGSIAGQLAGIGMGMQDKFSWRAVATSGLTAGIVPHVGTFADSGLGMVANAALKNVASQGIAMLTGQQKSFSWSSVAISAFSAPMMSRVKLEIGKTAFAQNNLHMGILAQNSAAAVVSATVKMVVTGGKISWGDVAADGIGNAVVSSMANQMRPSAPSISTTASNGTSWKDGFEGWRVRRDVGRFFENEDYKHIAMGDESIIPLGLPLDPSLPNRPVNVSGAAASPGAVNFGAEILAEWTQHRSHPYGVDPTYRLDTPLGGLGVTRGTRMTADQALAYDWGQYYAETAKQFGLPGSVGSAVAPGKATMQGMEFLVGAQEGAVNLAKSVVDATMLAIRLRNGDARAHATIALATTSAYQNVSNMTVGQMANAVGKAVFKNSPLGIVATMAVDGDYRGAGKIFGGIAAGGAIGRLAVGTKGFEVGPGLRSFPTGASNAASFTERSVFASYPERTTLQMNSVSEQVDFLSKHVSGINQTQAASILENGFSRDTSVVLGGSRIRGNFNGPSDLDVGFGNLTERQAQRVIKGINEQGFDVPLERLTIVPGKSTATIERIISPEEFFQRSGVRAGGDLRAGQPYVPSGSITFTKDGRIVVIPPGKF